jgi:hypothetical protein
MEGHLMGSCGSHMHDATWKAFRAKTNIIVNIIKKKKKKKKKSHE